MKKLMVLFALCSMALIGCDKGDKDNNDRYNDGYGYGYNSRHSGNNRSCYGGNSMRYRHIGNRCEDTRTGRQVDYRKCEQQNYNLEQRCGGFAGNQRYGGYQYGQWGNPNATACSIYDRPGETFVPVFYPNTGTTVCVGFSTFNQMGFGFNPMLWNGMSGVYQGCAPGTYGCASFGGTLGVSIGAGVGVGVGVGGGYRW